MRAPALLAFSLLFAAPALAHDTEPAPSASFRLFPGHAEAQSALDAVADHPWVTLHDVGESGEGRVLRVAVVTDPESVVPVAERVVTFLFTQQHGNEPAGTPAALQLLENLTSGAPIADSLENQVLILFPLVNPDGATREQRGNADGVDVNRDHVGLETTEARAIHEVLNRWDVHVALDHHEYGGLGPGVPGATTVYDADLTTLFPVHGNVRAPAKAAAESLMYDGLWPVAKEAGFTVNEYGEYEVAGQPVDQVAGGPDPGIMRNHMGLHHVAGLLIETRVDAHPNPVHDAERRTAIHRVVMEAALEYAHKNAAGLIAAKRAAEADALKDPARSYVEDERTGALADAYRVATDVGEVFTTHGLPVGVEVEETWVHDLRHDLRGHAAALLHPESSRAVVSGAIATEPPATVAAEPSWGFNVPAVGVLGLLALLAAARAGRRRA